MQDDSQAPEQAETGSAVTEQSGAEGKQKNEASVVNRRELLDRLSNRTGTSAATMAPVLLAALEELGQAIEAGETLAIPPLGRLRVTKGSPAEGHQYTIRLRRPKPEEELE